MKPSASSFSACPVPETDQLQFCLFSGVTARTAKIGGLWPLPAACIEKLSKGRRRRQRARDDRQAWGHWFEPSTAHRKALHKGFFVAQAGDAGQVVARSDARVGAIMPL